MQSTYLPKIFQKQPKLLPFATSPVYETVMIVIDLYFYKRYDLITTELTQNPLINWHKLLYLAHI